MPKIKLTAITAIILLVCALPILAKTRYIAGNDGGADSQASVSPAEIERRLRPALEERARIRRNVKNGGYQPGRNSITASKPVRPTINQQDLYLLMRMWESMTPEFRALYAEAADFPSGYGGYDSYVSPSGNFKIFYTTSGPDSINLVDTMGYGDALESSAWRTRHSGPNGVPDYIDEAGFALDSAWSMQIGRFGFPQPIPSREPTGPSTGPYNVLITNMDDYGVTLPHSGSRNPGFASHLEINGDWSGREWAGLGYDKRPYDALRVTCAHEFFHAIQYAMVWTIDLDDITYGWLEGSAVLMEEIAFPEVNDYLQYTGQFFTNPRLSLLSNNFNYLYMNGLVLKYLYEKASKNGESIGMIKAVHDNARAQRMITFHRNISQASSTHAQRPWAEVLNGFHAESYFTGTRARPGVFVSDAELMGSWRVPTAVAKEEENLSIGAYAVGFLRYEPQPDDPDTLVLSISGDRDRSVDGIIWGASALVTDGGGGATVAPIPIDQNGRGRFELAGWRGKSYCLLVLTNAGPPPTARNVTVRMGDHEDPVDTLRYAPLQIFPNTAKLSSPSPKPIRIAGGDISEIKILAQDGKVVDYWNDGGSGRGGGNGVFERDDGGMVMWHPQRDRRKKRLVPGVYFISASSINPDTNKKSTQRRKILLLP